MKRRSDTELTADTIVTVIGEILARHGAHAYLGEQVTMAEHMLQTAQQAEEAGADEVLIAAALLHDIGLFTEEFEHDRPPRGIETDHDKAGAAWLAPYFPAAVTLCVENHVAAKRYLCATDPAYAGKLSPSSVRTLNLQGGAMSDQEIREFARHPQLDAILQVRRWDDRAKVPGRVTPPFGHYAPLLQRIVDRRATEV